MEQGNKEMKRILVTFDIDGTLIQSTGSNSNYFYKAFSHVFLQVFGIHGTVDVIQPHGSTGRAILVNTLVHYGIPSEVATEKLPVLMTKMTEYAKAHSKDLAKGLEVLPGLETLLQALSLKDRFGSDHTDRGHVIELATERAERHFRGKFDLQLHPNDIKAAESGGALTVGVCTGVFRKEELVQAINGGAIILQDLCDNRSFFDLI
ncbi:Protein pelota-like protein, partial [Bienertia sinuspersici]